MSGEHPDHVKVGQLWADALAESGYSHVCHSQDEAQRLKMYPRVWRTIFKLISVGEQASFFELGCGGGRQLIPLALNGHHATGVDVSPAVIERARHFVTSVDRFIPVAKRITLECGDFFDYQPPQAYDCCFHFGVVEHFLDPADRARLWRKLAAMTRPGGWVVSVVPNGRHFLRGRVRQHGLLGYNIPEIDYSVQNHTQEFHDAGLCAVRVIPHSYLGFYPALPGSRWLGPFYRALYLAANGLAQVISIPPTLGQYVSQSLIAVGQKPHVPTL